MSNPNAVFKVKCDWCEANAKGIAKDLAEAGWKRILVQYPSGNGYVMACQLHQDQYTTKVNGEIGKGFGFRTQIGGITLKGISLGGKRKKVGLEERSDFGVRTASVADPATRMCGGMRA